jgi:hypothetical protein
MQFNSTVQIVGLRRSKSINITSGEKCTTRFNYLYNSAVFLKIPVLNLRCQRRVQIYVKIFWLKAYKTYSHNLQGDERWRQSWQPGKINLRDNAQGKPVRHCHAQRQTFRTLPLQQLCLPLTDKKKLFTSKMRPLASPYINSRTLRTK